MPLRTHTSVQFNTWKGCIFGYSLVVLACSSGRFLEQFLQQLSISCLIVVVSSQQEKRALCPCVSKEVKERQLEDLLQRQTEVGWEPTWGSIHWCLIQSVPSIHANHGSNTFWVVWVWGGFHTIPGISWIWIAMTSPSSGTSESKVDTY